VKNKLYTIRWIGVIVLISILAGAGAGRALPMLPGIAEGNSASAAELSIKPVASLAPLTPTGSGFTYQGSLKSGGNPANGNYDFVFTLYDDPSVGVSVTTPITLTNQTVTAGLFTVSLDFGTSAFDGNGRWLEIAVRQSGGGGYTTLTPRQSITPAPYALFALKTTPYKNVVVVAQSGGQYTSITSALNSITDNSSTNRYLITVGLGTYTETVTMKQYVDIEGSGEQNTKITFTGTAVFSTGTVVGANNAELRSLTVANTGGNTYATAIYNSSAAPSLLQVTATASGGTNSNYGVVNNSSSSPIMTNVTATASGASFNNVGVYNSSSSPIMTNVTATASGASFNAGVYNSSSSSPIMTNVTATASGASSSNYGVYNYNASSPNMTNVTATASGASSSNYGVYNDFSSPRIVTSIIIASGATTFGVYSYGGTVTIDNSKITAGFHTIYNDSGTTTRVGASQLSGGNVFNAGTLTCSASYDGSNKRLGTDCTRNTKVAIVGLTDGDYNSIQAALNDTATWCGTPSATNKCLVRVGPGTYTERVTMVQYVDIEGAGEQTTKISFTGSAGSNTGTVLGANNAELRSLTVENTGGNSYAIAIYNAGASPSLRNVTASASGGSIVTFGVYNTSSSSPNITNVTASASGGSDNRGLYNDSSSPRIVTSNIGASGGTFNFGVSSYTGGTVTIDSSKVTGSTNTIFNAVGVTTRVGASQLSGGNVSNSGTLTCSASYDENYVSPGLNVCP
jgi:pectin methylesterase-like acyl-CoA thioesterase